MFGHWLQTVLMNHETASGWGRRWSEWVERRDRERGDAELIHELQWQWRSACAATSLSQIIYTPSGPTRAVPMIGHVDLGPPVSFTVRVRPGQTLADFTVAAPSIAPSLGATALKVVPLVSHWVRIVLVQTPLVAVPDLEPALEPVLEPALEPQVGTMRVGA